MKAKIKQSQQGEIMQRILALILGISAIATPAHAQGFCLNYWINPRTGIEECLNNFQAPRLAKGIYTSQDFAVSNFKITLDPLDAANQVVIQGQIKNTGQSTVQLETIDIEFQAVNRILTSVIVPLSGQLKPGQTRIIKWNVFRNELGNTPLRQITAVPVAVDFR